MLDQPTRDRRSERRSSTSAEILSAAWALARSDGLIGFTMRDVARQVGMRAPSLYSYFESKHAIYDAMFAQGCRDYLAGDARVPYTGDPLTDLQLGMRFFLDFCIADPVRYQLLYQRTIPGFEPSAESFALAEAGLATVRARLASSGFADPAALDLLTAVGTGLTSQQISNDPGGDRWVRLADEAMEMLFHHLSRRDQEGTS